MYSQSGTGILQHAEAIKLRGSWIPVIWPHDGSQHDKGSGISLADQYRKAGVNFVGSHFQNPEGGLSVEAGLMSMLTRLQTGRLKVFSHLQEWFREFRIYHRKDGKVIRQNDDLMSATRYAIQSLRFATVNNWQPRAEYSIGSISDKTYNPFDYWEGSDEQLTYATEKQEVALQST